MQPTRRSVKRRRHSIWFRLYMVLVVISAIIVATYIGLHLAIRAPEIPQTELDPPLPPAVRPNSPPPRRRTPQRPGEKGRRLYLCPAGQGCEGQQHRHHHSGPLRYRGPDSGDGLHPRDTAVHRTWSKYSKINAAFYGSSPETLKEEIQNTFGIPVDYYILVDPKGFIALVDELDGVDVYIPEDMNYDAPHPGEELHIHSSDGDPPFERQAGP